MKIFKKLTALSLSCLMLTGVAFGCAENEKETETTEKGESIAITENRYEDGIHQLNYTETDKYLVKDKRSDYRILVAEGVSTEIETAAIDLQNLFYEATAVRLPIVEDGDMSDYSPSAKVISLGETKYAKAVSAEAAEELEFSGYSIETVDESIFITANTDVGVSFGVYGFLELQFNFDCFSNTLYYIDEQDDVLLRDYDVLDAPDLRVRTPGTAFLTGPTVRRMKYANNSDIIAGHSTSHSSFLYIPPETYKETHSEWFSTCGNQLCYTARGDAESRAVLIETAVDAAIEAFKNAPEATQFVFSHMDINTWCACDSCKASLQKYGTNAAVAIQFVNEMAEAVEKWMKSEEGKEYARNFKIVFLAYKQTYKPPVKYVAGTDTYEPIDESVILHDHVTVQLAPIELEWGHSIYAECNKDMYEGIRGWESLTDHFSWYTYTCNYNYYWLFYDTFEGLSDFYKLAAEYGTERIYELGQARNNGGTGFLALKNYIAAKLTWDVNLDMDDIIEKFFQYYYADAGDEMYEVYLGLRALSKSNVDILCKRKSCDAKIDIPELWPKALLVKWLEKIDEGVEDIAYLKKVDPERYTAVYNNVMAESVSLGYLLINHYEDQLNQDYAQRIKMQTMQAAESNGIDYFAEGPFVYSTSIWSSWGIS